MLGRATAGLLVLGILSGGASTAESDFLACVTVKNDIARLQCFDAAASQKLPGNAGPAETPGCKQMQLVDLQLDISQLNGRCIRTTGQVTSFGGMVMISRGNMANPIMASVDGLAREQRKILLNCKVSCRLNIEGIVEPVMLQPGLRLTRIEKP